MALPVASGAVSYSGTFTPEIWSRKILDKFYAGTVLSEITNTDYEGEIKKQGDKVNVRNRPDVIIRDYTKGQKLTYTAPEPTTAELLIDKGKYWALPVNAVDVAQWDIDAVNQFTMDAAEQLKISVERDFFADSAIYNGAATANKGATAGVISSGYNMGAATAPISITNANALQKLIEIGCVLSEQNIPEDQRFVVIPVWWSLRLKLSDLKSATITGDDTSPLRTGLLGQIDGMKVYRSNLLKTMADTLSGSPVTSTIVMAGHPKAISFALQLTADETLKNPDDFGDLHRGLKVYGYKVFHSDALVNLRCTPGSIS